jgi:hypothetical protein
MFGWYRRWRTRRTQIKITKRVISRAEIFFDSLKEFEAFLQQEMSKGKSGAAQLIRVFGSGRFAESSVRLTELIEQIKTQNYVLSDAQRMHLMLVQAVTSIQADLRTSN